MPDTQTEPWPDWLENLTPDERVKAIARGLSPAPGTDAHLSRADAERFLIRLLDEARAEPAPAHAGLTEAQWLDQIGRVVQDPAAGGLRVNAETALIEVRERVATWQRERHIPAEPAAVPSATGGLRARIGAALEESLAQAVAALHRLALDEPMTEPPDADAVGLRRWLSAELTARREHAAGTLETIAWLADELPAPRSTREVRNGNPAASEPVMELLEQANGLLGDASVAVRSVPWDEDLAAWQARYRALVARYAAGKAEPVPPLVPEGTYVHAAIKGFIERDGYLFTGQWLGDPHMVILRDKDGVFADVFPRSSVHLISAQPEPGSEPEQPDPWAQTLEDVRADAAVLERNWRADRDKLIALRTWAESFLEGDDALREVLEIFERDFRPQEVDEEAPF